MIFKKKVSILIIMMAILSMLFSYGIATLPYSTSYDTSTSQTWITSKRNSVSTLTYNTRPSSGYCGAHAYVWNFSDNILLGDQVFPYYSSIPDYSTTIPANKWIRGTIQPASSGYTIKGNIYYSIANAS